MQSVMSYFGNVMYMQECMKRVSIYPMSSESGMLSQLNQRSYWCISRQRVWGLPIPVFYSKATGNALINR